MTAVISEIKRVSEVYLNFTHSVHFHSADPRKRWLCKRFPYKRAMPARRTLRAKPSFEFNDGKA